MVAMKRSNFLAVFGVLALLILITAGVVLYARGYRLDLRQKTLTTTGVIWVKSNPDGAKIFLEDEFVGVTNTALSSLEPGTHRIRIEKEGLQSWEGDVKVEEGLVTDIGAILPPISSSLKAITQNGVRLVTPAPSGTKTVFFSGDSLYIISLSSPFLGFLPTKPQLVAEEASGFPFSKVTGLVFSPNEDQILAVAGKKGMLYPIGPGASQTVSSPSALIADWQEEAGGQRAETVKTLEVSEELKDLALSKGNAWSPDERKFLYEKVNGGKREIWLANFADPLPVGESLNAKLWETEDPNLKIFWLANSHHFILLEEGTVSLLDLDGSNKRELFSGNLDERVAMSSSDLAQVIIATSFSTNSKPNLYAISLR